LSNATDINIDDWFLFWHSPVLKAFHRTNPSFEHLQ